MGNDILGIRLRNCLATILEMEDSLDQTPLGPALHDEFAILKDVMQRLENAVVEEQDVCRIEKATARFLAELKDTLGETVTGGESVRGLLQ
ncbi:hypothetical protein LJC46_05820 [Desulfovibrio sp. OttesenSCG-928-G15]|nr:hypothetical protein [Desulfovibrio sp. OttesenSCG-928-G15]